MNKGFCYDHIQYDLLDTKNGKICINKKGILCNNRIHVDWVDIIEYLKNKNYNILTNDKNKGIY
jgi:hypothetical protein